MSSVDTAREALYNQLLNHSEDFDRLEQELIDARKVERDAQRRLHEWETTSEALVKALVELGASRKDLAKLDGLTEIKINNYFQGRP